MVLTQGMHPVVQEHFPPDYRTVLEVLQAAIRTCDAVVCLVGWAYGREPRQRLPEEPRRSYTQLEYAMARHLGKPVYLFLAHDDCPPDAPIDEAAELRQLQQAYRATLGAGDQLCYAFRAVAELREQIAVINWAAGLTPGPPAVPPALPLPGAPSMPENPFYGESPHMLGRQAELARLFDKLRAGNHCSLVGPPGSGKTRLLQEIWRLLPARLGWPASAMLRLHFRGVANVRDLQTALVMALGGQRAQEWRALLQTKPVRFLILDDLGGMDAGAGGLAMRQWLRSLDDAFGTKLLMSSNTRLDVLFRRDDPTISSPLAGLDPLPVQLPPLPRDICQQLVEQRLAGTPWRLAHFAEVLLTPLQPQELLQRCAIRYEARRGGAA